MRPSLLVCAVCGLGLTIGTAWGATVAQWDFSEGSGTSANSSVGGYTGTLVNFPSTAAGIGNPAGAIGWTSDGRLNLNRDSGQPGAARVETTFPLNTLIGKSFTLEFMASHNNVGQGWSPLIAQSGGCCFFLGKTAGQSSLHQNLNGLGGATNSQIINNLADGQMHHMALVFNDAANSAQFFFDYQPAGVVGLGGTLTDRGLLWLGSPSHQPVNEYWNGYVDAVRISDEALAPTQLLGAPASVSPAPGVAAWWRMEEGNGGSVADASGNGFHAGLRGLASTVAGAGNSTESGWASQLVAPLTDRGATLANTGAIRLDGADDFVQTSLPVPTGSFTVEAIVAAENAAAGWSPIFGESLASGNTGLFYFGKQSGTGELHVNIAGLTSTGYVVSNANIADGNPHHIALIFDPLRDSMMVYVDHKLANFRPGVTGLPTPLAGSTLRLASRDDTHAAEKFDGKIDEARVWNVATVPHQMLAAPSFTGVQLVRSFGDDFESGNQGWNFMQNAGNDVRIIAEPGNPANQVLQLVGPVNDRATAAILEQRDVVRAFDAQFRFRVPAGSGADGFTFGAFDVPYHLGGAGGNLGAYLGALAGQAPGFVVEFDMYAGGTAGETDGNHVEIHRNYDANGFLGPSPDDHRPAFALESIDWTYARVVLDNGYLSVWLNQAGFDFSGADLLIDREYLGDVDLNGNGQFDPFLGYFGFTAGTGGLNNQIIIDNFSLTVVPEPSTIVLLAFGLAGMLAARRGRRP